MKTWLIFAIISVFAAGFHNFASKIAAERYYDISLINIISYFTGALLIGIYIIYDFKNINFSNIYLIIFLSFFSSFVFFLSTFSRIESMKNIDTVIFFPLYKTIGPIFITFISLFYFGESLNLKEIIGIIIGIFIPLLLITSSEKKRQKNVFLGILLVLVTAILTSIGSSIAKKIMVNSFDINLYIFITSIFGTIFSIISYFLFKNGKKLKKTNGILKFSIISGILYILSFISFTLALKGNLAIVYTVNSFSILIPIILSIIFYKEHFNFKKGFVIFLSIVSILLFI